LSWNYKQLANIKKEIKILSANIAEGYTKSFKILTPFGVIYEENK